MKEDDKISKVSGVSCSLGPHQGLPCSEATLSASRAESEGSDSSDRMLPVIGCGC